MALGYLPPCRESEKTYRANLDLLVFFEESAMSNSPPLRCINPHRAFYGIWLPEWLKSRSEVSSTAKLLYAELCRFAGSDGVAWPSYHVLARNLCVSRRHVIRLLSELVQHRLVLVTHRRDQAQGNGSNLYRFLWHPWMEENGESSSHPSFKPACEPNGEHANSPLVTPSLSLASEGPPPGDIGVTRASDNTVTPLVTKMSPKENHRKRIIKECPKGASSSSVAFKATAPRRETHRLTAAFKPVSALFNSPPQRPHQKPTDFTRKVWKTGPELPFPPTTRPHSAQQSDKKPKHSGQERKQWALTRKLLKEFWDNCKIKPDTRVLYGYATRSLQSGLIESQALSAFERALHECHGHATDVGERWEASSTVHRAEAFLRRSRDQERTSMHPTQATQSEQSHTPPLAKEQLTRSAPSNPQQYPQKTSRNEKAKPHRTAPEERPSPDEIKARFNACRQAVGLPTRS